MGFIQSPARLIIDLLQTGGTLLELGLFEVALLALVFAGQVFGVDQKAEAFLEGQGRGVGFLLLFPEVLGHGGQLEGPQLLHGGFTQHVLHLLRGGTVILPRVAIVAPGACVCAVFSL